MSKITFRADDDLVRRLEERDASKSEIMRTALREYLDTDAQPTEPEPTGTSEGTLDEFVASRVDELVAERFRERAAAGQPQDVNVNVTLEREETATTRAPEPAIERSADVASSADNPCAQCGETLESDHVFCPNCGEKASRRVFCDCGDEIRTDWAFCPGCGRRTPSADVLDQS